MWIGTKKIRPAHFQPVFFPLASIHPLRLWHHLEQVVFSLIVCMLSNKRGQHEGKAHLLDAGVAVVHEKGRYGDHQTHVLRVRSHHLSQERCHELATIRVKVRLFFQSGKERASRV